MRIKKRFPNREHARKYYLDKTDTIFYDILKSKNIDRESIASSNLEDLIKKKHLILGLLADEEFLKSNVYDYINDVDFYFTNKDPQFYKFRFTIKDQLEKLLNSIYEKIESIRHSKSVDSVNELVGELPETDTKSKIQISLKNLKNEDQKKISKITVEKSTFNEVIEIERHKADMFEKKTDTWLKILGRESIASILGAVLLLILTICIIVNMFLGQEPIKIIETAFLLILGYFFGQSVSKNKTAP